MSCVVRWLSICTDWLRILLCITFCYILVNLSTMCSIIPDLRLYLKLSLILQNVTSYKLSYCIFILNIFSSHNVREVKPFICHLAIIISFGFDSVLCHIFRTAGWIYCFVLLLFGFLEFGLVPNNTPLKVSLNNNPSPAIPCAHGRPAVITKTREWVRDSGIWIIDM